MNNANYGYPRSDYTSPYSSTPSSLGPNRSRFGYSGPSFYPRPRSSASKPNPDSFSDSMVNNYGNSTSRIDSSFGSDNENTYDDDAYKNNSGSNYYSANDTVYPDLYPADSSMMRGGSMGMARNSLLPSDIRNAGNYSNPPAQYGETSYNYSSASFGMNNGEHLKGAVQKALLSSFGLTNRKQTLSTRKFGKAKRKMAATQPGTWRCQLCNLDFTSQIPYDMHLRGARHAKKLKSKDVSPAVQPKATVGSTGEKSYFCMLCNVTTNSLLQFQTHLEGNKHKNKLNPKEPKDPKDTTQGDTQEAPKKGKKKTKAKADASLSGTNGSLTRPLPDEFGEPQPAKLTKFSCDICSISVNSAVQLQQHLASKKHQNKVEGKPVIKGKKNKVEKNEAMDTDAVETAPANENTEPAAYNEEAKTVVGVKTLSSSFVQGGTLQ